jgi:hypothetical protein
VHRVSRSATWIRVAIAAIVVLVVIAIVASIVGGDDDGSESTTTTGSTSTSTSTISPDDDFLVVWPYEGAGLVRDPVEVTRTFATAYLHVTNPVVGAFQTGASSDTGTVELRSTSRGPATSVQLRQRTDGAWFVTGSATDDIDLDSHEVGATVASPVEVRGQALAFEGTVVVEVRQDGSDEPIGKGVVTGGGDVKRPFDGSIDFDEPAKSTGALVLYTESAEDGSVSSAVVVAVRFS